MPKRSKSRRGKGVKEPKQKPSYPLEDVRGKIAQGKYRINPDVQIDAHRDFGWGTADIEDAFQKLQPKHFYKTDPSEKIPGVMLDVYQAPRLKKEDVYTHFYIREDGCLVINSLHKLD